MQDLDIDKLQGLKASDIHPCVLCGGPLGKGGPMIMVVTIERYLIDPQAARRMIGQELMMGSTIAGILGVNEDIAKRFVTTGPNCICGECALERKIQCMYLLEEDINRAKLKREGKKVDEEEN